MTQVRETLAGRTLLVTGFTGFVGKVFVALLLERVPEVRLVVLSRPRRGRSAAQRVQTIIEESPCFRPLRDALGDSLGDYLEGRLMVVEGDTKKPGLGIDETTAGALLSEIDAVVHVAGLTDFVPDPREGIATNTRGALYAADVAARTRGRQLLHVSTCFVAGQGSRTAPETLVAGRSPNGTRFDPEGELLAIDSLCEAIDERIDDAVASRKERIDACTKRALALGWPNLYTYTKGLAEHLLAERDDIGITIARPSIVECARETPFAGWNEGINTSGPLVWLVGTPHRRMPFRADYHFDVVPVDAVAKGMILGLCEALHSQPRGVGTIYQLASSDHNPLTLGRALDLTTLARRRQFAKSDDPFERFVLSQLDSVLAERSPTDDPILPAARRATRFLRDTLVSFNPDHYLPREVAAKYGKTLTKHAQKWGKTLGKASRTMGQIEQILEVYQPFIYDDDLVFRTDNIRALSAELSEDERLSFGFDVHTIDWRQYWLDVQMPGLDRWSLPLLRGERVANDPPRPLTTPLRSIDRGDFIASVGVPMARVGARSFGLGDDAE